MAARRSSCRQRCGRSNGGCCSRSLCCAGPKQLKPRRGDPALIVHSPAAAFALADDLARLIDDMTTRQVPWERLDRLVPDNHDRYWQLTLDFLKIAREYWPAILSENADALRSSGAARPADRGRASKAGAP